MESVADRAAGDPRRLVLVFLDNIDRYGAPCHTPSEGEGAGPGCDAAVRDAIERALTDKQREAVELYYFVGLTEAAIAARLGVSQQVVHKRLHGAVRGGRRVGGALARLKEALLPLAKQRRWA